MARSYKALVSLFRRLGARDPEGRARSEVDEGIPQLMAFLVMRGMWSGVIGDEDTAWIEEHVASAAHAPKGPTAGVGAALRRLLAAGADPKDLSEVVRGMQYSTLFRIAYVLDDALSALDGVRDAVPELAEVDWSLFEVNADGEPIRPISGGLHEIALSMDPTGREMRPRSGPGVGARTKR